VILGVALFSVCTTLFALVHVFWFALLMLACNGVGNTISGVLRGTTNQLLTPDNLRGRVSAVNSAFVTGGPQLGQFRSGVVADLIGATGSGVLGGLGALACSLAVALVPGVWRFQLAEAGETAKAEMTQVAKLDGDQYKTGRRGPSRTG
jgi:MFS family permease